MSNDIVGRGMGMSNDDMLEYLSHLKAVWSQQKEVKIGRGKTIEVSYVYKYDKAEENLERIERSMKHYEKLKAEEPEVVEPTTKIEFRGYQVEAIDKGIEILRQHRFLYIAMEVRTGKTLVSMGIADKIGGVKHVLFVTKKKAINNIKKDYEDLSPSYQITVINYESLHVVMSDEKWDLIIFDEAHGMGAFPKPSDRAKMAKDLIEAFNPYVVLLSGTPTPESYSQMYHQVYGIPNNPFRQYKNFYRFADDYVKVKQKKVNGLMINDYNNGLPTILDAMKPFTITYTQKDSGFVSNITEEIVEVEMRPQTYAIIEKLRRDLVVEGKTNVILADTAVKLMMKEHQLYSGTIKFESGDSMVIDDSKATFIKEYFDGCKIAIFYKFKEEFLALKQVYGDQLTDDISVFKDTDKNIALQIISGREGISLKEADYLVYFNIDFSATSYWQSRDRMTTKDREFNHVYYIFSKGGIEHDIYKTVLDKKDYTLNHYKKFKANGKT